jgi:hypothetical protein
MFSLHRVVSSSIWLFFQTHGEFVLPPASWTYVNVMLPESDHQSCYCPREFFPNLIWSFYSLSLDLMLVHLKSPIKSVFEINEVLCLIIKILLFVPRWAVEDLWIVNSYTHTTLLPKFWIFLSCCLSSEDLISNHQASLASLRWILYMYIFWFLRCRSIVYFLWIHFT